MVRDKKLNVERGRVVCSCKIFKNITFWNVEMRARDMPKFLQIQACHCMDLLVKLRLFCLV